MDEISTFISYNMNTLGSKYRKKEGKWLRTIKINMVLLKRLRFCLQLQRKEQENKDDLSNNAVLTV